MPATSSYQSVFRIAKLGTSSSETSTAGPWGKRNRQSLSCTACRTRKMKCDRLHPCTSCSKRGYEDAMSCNYSSDRKSNRKRASRDSIVRESSNSEAQIRLQKLEDMVTGLIHSTQQDTTGSDGSLPCNDLNNQSSQSVTRAADNSSILVQGHLDINGSETKYYGATSWTSVLESIRDLKDVLDSATGDDGVNGISTETIETLPPDLFVGTSQNLTLQEIWRTLPSRVVMDKVLSAYFNAKHNQGPILHIAKFLREYETFWARSSPVSFLWISILYSALYIGCRVLEMSSRDLGVPLPDSDDLLNKAGQALVCGKYQDGHPYSIEALLFYSTCKHMEDKHCEKHMWVFITARLALRMGYHRDPKILGNISPFEGEMRRRIFSQVEVMDLLLSFQAGLPPVIPEDECDTEPPSNLLDTDFDEDCKVLPPSRPTSDPTSMLYYCEKSRLARLLRLAVRHALSLKNPPFEETMRIDKELRDAHLLVPESLRMRPLTFSFVDQSYIILHRLNVEVLYLRSTCVLHRKYLVYERSNPSYEYSRTSCLAAALQILEYQAEVHLACQPGGQLYADRWMMTSSLITYDFLLAVMIICLELYESRNEPVIDQQVRRKRYYAVKNAHKIWEDRDPPSKESRRASVIIASLLSRVVEPSTAEMNQTVTMTSTGTEAPTNPFSPLVNVHDEGCGSSSVSAGIQHENYLDSVFSESDYIDWGFVDQYLIEKGNDIAEPSFEW